MSRSLPIACLTVVLTLSLIVPRTAHAVESSDCDCYITDGPSSASFQFHRFFDFRNVNSTIDPGSDYDGEPANVTATQLLGNEPGQQGYLNSSNFLADWSITNWTQKAEVTHPILMRNSRQNVWIQKNPDDDQITHLALRTNRNKNFSSSGELKSLQAKFFHASIRVNARVRGDSGAVAGLFTYFNDSTESDIEILTRDPANEVHYTNQPSTDSFGHTIAAAELTRQLPHQGVWTDWTRHRLDWLPNLSAWYANDMLLAKTAYGIPQFPSYLVLNIWSNGGSWSGNMSVGSAAYLEIQWIDIVFNTSESGASSSFTCVTKCGVDKVNQVGTPQIVSGSILSMSVGNLSLLFLCSALWISVFVFGN